MPKETEDRRLVVRLDDEEAAILDRLVDEEKAASPEARPTQATVVRRMIRKHALPVGKKGR